MMTTDRVALRDTLPVNYMPSSFEELQQAMQVMGTIPQATPKPSKPDEYSGPDGVDGATIAPSDPIMDSAGAPTAPPITAAQRGKTLNTGQPALPTAPPAGVVASYPATTPETSSAAPTPNPGALKLVFTGMSGAGKSTIAKQLGFTELQIQDPIVALYRRYFPGQEPPADFLNTVLVWGEGAIDPKTPVTPARLLFIDFIRQQSADLGGTDFGTPGFWQRSLLLRAAAASVNGPVVVTTCTTGPMLTALKDAGFQHFHIACSNQTLPTRKRRQGANDALANTFSNQLVREVSMHPQGPQLPCIWNDGVPAPSPRFLTLETLKQMLVQNQQSIITGE